jgi:hypothetical protein
LLERAEEELQSEQARAMKLASLAAIRLIVILNDVSFRNVIRY